MARFRDPFRITAERRDPTAATKSLRWVTPNRAQPPDWNASLAYSVAYYMEPITFACVSAIAELISGVSFRAGPDPMVPERFNPNAALARLLGSEPPGGPCPGLGASDLWYAAIRDWLVTGRFGWEIETPPGSDTPVALWPLTAAALTPVPTGSGTQWFSGFKYGRPGDERKLNAGRVFYAWRPHGLDFRQPESALQAAQLPVSIAVMQARYDYSFLKNDARPATVVVTEPFADEDDAEAFKAQWNTNFGGPDSAGKAAFLEAKGGDQGVKGAVDVTVVGVSPKDAQAQQRAEARQREIAIALGVPFSRLDASQRTFANADQEDEIFKVQKLRPLMRRLQNAVNVQLAPRVGPEFGWFDLSQLDELLASTRPQAPAVPTAAPPVEPTAPPDPAIADALVGLEERVMERLERIVVRAPGPVPAPEPPAPGPPPDEEARRAKVWTSTDGRVRNLERQWERALRRLFARQQRSALARLEGKRGRQLAREARALADEVFDPHHWAGETEDETVALYEAVTAAGGARVSDLLGLAFDLDSPWAQDFIHARANQLAGPVTQTTYEQIQGALSAGVAEGEGIPQLAARVREVFDTASKTRATTIARTEVISAYNGSATLTATSYGSDVVAGQEWIATRDSRTRDQHAERDGEIVDVGALFSGGLAYPGDPSGDPADVVNCRCTVAFLTPDEMQGRAPRLVETRLAAVVLRLVRPGAGDVERGIRAALKAAA